MAKIKKNKIKVVNIDREPTKGVRMVLINDSKKKWEWNFGKIIYFFNKEDKNNE